MDTPAAEPPRDLAPLLQRVLIVEEDAAARSAAVETVRAIGPCQLWTPQPGEALELAAATSPTLLIVGEEAAHVVRALRRSDGAAARSVVVMTAREATVARMITAREAGAHELLRRPLSRAELVRRLMGLARDPRDWIETATYVGPDRRRFNDGGRNRMRLVGRSAAA